MTEPIPFWEDWRFWQIVVTSAFAFFGFFMAAWAKYLFDLRLDRRLRNVEIVAVTDALVAELRKLHFFSNGHAAKLRQPPRATFRAIVANRPPNTPFFEKMTGQQLGLLNPEALLKLIEAHYRHEFLTRLIKEAIGTDNPNPEELANDETLERLCRRHDELAEAAMTAVRALNSSRPKL